MPLRKMPERMNNEILDALRSRGVRSDCPFCGRDEGLSIGEWLYLVPIQDSGPRDLDEIATPFANLRCLNCGFTALFNLHELSLENLVSELRSM